MPRVHATATMPPGGASGVFPPAICLSSRSCHTFASFRRWIYQGEYLARIRSAPVLPAHRSCCPLPPLSCGVEDDIRFPRWVAFLPPPGIPSTRRRPAFLRQSVTHRALCAVICRPGFMPNRKAGWVSFAFALARQRSFRRGPHAFSAKRRFLFQALLSRHVSPLSRRIGDSYFPDSHGHRSPPIGWPSRAAG